MKTLNNTFLTPPLQSVEDAIELHKNGKNAPLSIDVLNKVKSELTEMIRVMDPQEYKPSYPRFIMDWPDETGLISALIDADYNYKKIRKKK